MREEIRQAHPKGWKKVEIGIVADMITEKISTSKLTLDNYISTENLLPNKGGYTKATTLPNVDRVNRYQQEDILFSNIRAYFKKVWYADIDGGASNDVIIFRSLDIESINSRFLYYILSSDQFINFVVLSSKGTKMPRGDKDAISKYGFLLPDIKTQTQIASIISTYDDLIENNEKRIKTLEEMAQRLYTEWFVNFKFPGHEKVKMVDSGTEYGKVPEGWEFKSLKDFAVITMGQSPKSEFYNEKGLGLPFHQGVKDFNDLYPTIRVFSTEGNQLAERGDLLFSVRAPVGRMNIATDKIIIGRGLSSIRHINKKQSFLISVLFNRFTEKDMLGNGSIYKSINKGELETLQFLYPSDSLVDKFESIASKYFEEIKVLSDSNKKLIQIRDVLIENLVTGKRLLKNEYEH